MPIYNRLSDSTTKRISWGPVADDASFMPTSYILASTAVFSLLLGAYVSLALLWATDVLATHLFDVNRIDGVTQIIVGVSQATTIVSTAIISYVVQQLASTSVIRESKSVIITMHFYETDA